MIQELVDGVQNALHPTEANVDKTSQLIHQANLATAATNQQTL